MKPKFSQGQARAAQIHRDLPLTRNTFELARPQAKAVLAAPKTPAVQNFGVKPDLSANTNSTALKNEMRFAPGSEEYQAAFNAGVSHARQSMEAAFRKQLEVESETLKAQHFNDARNAGYRDGKDLGYADGKSLALNELGKSRVEYVQQTQSLSALIASLRRSIDQKYAQMQDDLSEICFIGLAQLLVENMIKPEVINAKIIDLLQQQISNDHVDVHLHPDDYHALSDSNSGGQTAPQLALQFKNAKFNLIADPEVKLGGVLMRSGKNSLDARLDYQLEQIKQTILLTRDVLRGQHD